MWGKLLIFLITCPIQLTVECFVNDAVRPGCSPFDPMPISGNDISSQGVACHHTTYSINLISGEEIGSWYQPMLYIKINDGQLFHKSVNIVGSLGYVVDKFCLDVCSLVCAMYAFWKSYSYFFPCEIFNDVMCARAVMYL